MSNYVLLRRSQITLSNRKRMFSQARLKLHSATGYHRILPEGGVVNFNSDTVNFIGKEATKLWKTDVKRFGYVLHFH